MPPLARDLAREMPRDLDLPDCRAIPLLGRWMPPLVGWMPPLLCRAARTARTARAARAARAARRDSRRDSI